MRLQRIRHDLATEQQWGSPRQENWSGLPFLPPVDHILTELYTMTRPSRWPCMASLIASLELYKPSCHDKAMTHEGDS